MGFRKETWLKIFGWLEIVMGGLGLFLLTVCSVLLLITGAGLREAQPGDFGFLGVALCTIPAPFLFWLGISTLKARPQALRITAWMSALVFIFIALLFFWGGAYLLAIITVVIGVILAWLYNRSRT